MTLYMAVVALLWTVLILTSIVYAQEPQIKERSVKSYQIQLQQVILSRNQCEVNLSDIWEQGEMLDKENRRLKGEVENLNSKKEKQDEKVKD